ncbi:hypothetical protein LUZ60_010770 [Juncus effusus]|nr:hypothetical protein LUZ60_010770 [Juncus effusus]
MAKGRRYGPDRLLGTCGFQSNNLLAGPEFHESEVWSGSVEPDSDRTGWAPSKNIGGLSIAFNGGPIEIRRPIETRHVTGAASAPVNVPDWSRFKRDEPVETVVEPDVNEDDEWVPPHVYLARGNMTGVTSSVFEGVGRTLKGRDMSRVRDAVWNQTGFFG